MRGDEDAAQLVFAKLHARLLEYARYHTLRVDLEPAYSAEDAVSDAIVRLLTQYRRGGAIDDRGRLAFAAYLRTLVVRVLLDRRRGQYASKRDAGAPLEQVELDDTTRAQALSREPSVSRQIAAADLRDFCLSLLDAFQREVWALAIEEGLTHAQIAERLQVPVTRVKTALREARNRLGELFDGRDW